MFSGGYGTAYALEERLYDVVVIGAGSGGCSATLEMTRMGMYCDDRESDWIGGQMTGAAVSTMDDKTKTRTGLYLSS